MYFLFVPQQRTIGRCMFIYLTNNHTDNSKTIEYQQSNNLLVNNALCTTTKNNGKMHFIYFTSKETDTNKTRYSNRISKTHKNQCFVVKQYPFRNTTRSNGKIHIYNNTLTDTDSILHSNF